MHIHAFHGGLELPRHKDVSTAQAIRPCPLPARLRLALLQHSGDPSEASVAVGDRVQAGQCIARASGIHGAHLHAPACGTVAGIAPMRLAYPPGVEVNCIEIEVDAGAQRSPLRLPAIDWHDASPETLRERIHACGVVGLGGAGFPASVKLASGRGTLIINGAECEPYISCDDILLRERADHVLRGALVLARAISASRLLLAIEDRMPAARQAVDDALELLPLEPDLPEIEIVSVPTIYPEGGERQLIKVLTGLEVPRGGLPVDIGVLVHNVATAAAAWRAVNFGEPLTHRIVTVTGPGVTHPCNLEVALGTPVAALIAEAGGYTDQAARLLIGGPMMGVALPEDDYPIGKTSNCVLVMSEAQVREPIPEMPCIRCGACADVCPAQLQPQQLLWHIRAQNWERTEADGVFDCIECGCCDLACPSHIPLVRQYRFAKSEIRHRQSDARSAAAAKLRFEQRQQRLAREAEERIKRQAERESNAASPQGVAEAIARAKARKASMEADRQDLAGSDRADDRQPGREQS